MINILVTQWYLILIIFLNSFGFETSWRSVSRLADESYNIINSLPKNFVRDGSIDYTKHVQKAINEYDNLVFPDFPIMVTVLNVGSDKRIFFKKGASLIRKPTTSGSYNVIQLRDVSNVTLVNPVIIGDRKRHKGTDGQWGMGIGIYSSRNIRIENAHITDCWGDGIYIGKSSQTLTPSRNIYINNAYCNNNRRNAISVISVDGFTLESSYLGSTNGQAPMVGIDFEPNDPIDVLRDIKVSNLTTENNDGGGILIFLNNLYGDKDKEIDITIENHVDNGSLYGARIINEKKNKASANVLGVINFNNASWKGNSKRSLNGFRVEEVGVKLNFKNMEIYDLNNRKLTTKKRDSLLRMSINRISRHSININ